MPAGTVPEFTVLLYLSHCVVTEYICKIGLLLLIASSMLAGQVSAQQPVMMTPYHHPDIKAMYELADSLRWSNQHEAAIEEVNRIFEEETLTDLAKDYGRLLKAFCFSEDSNPSSARTMFLNINSDVDTSAIGLTIDYYFTLGNYFHSPENYKFDSAFIYYRHVEKIAEQVEMEQLYEAYLINRIGEVYNYGFFDEINAQRYFRRALNIRIEALDDMSFDLGISYYNQSAIERSRGEFVLSIAYGKRALEIAKFHQHDRFELLCYNLIANTYNNADKYEESQYWFKILFEEAKKNENISERWLLFAYSNYSGALAELQEFEEAIQINRHVIDVYEQSGSTNNNNYTHAHFIIASSLEELGELLEADEEYKRTFELYSKTYGRQSVEFTNMLYYYGRLKVKLDDIPNAIGVYKEMLNTNLHLWNTLYDEEAFKNIPQSAAEVGKIYLHAEQFDSAAHYFDLAETFHAKIKDQFSFDDSYFYASSRLQSMYDQKIYLTYHHPIDQATQTNDLLRDIEFNKYRVFEENRRQRSYRDSPRNDSLSIAIYQYYEQLDALEIALEADTDRQDQILIDIKEVKRKIQSLRAINTQETSQISNDVSIVSIQHHLNNDELMIEMYAADSITYLVFITKNNISIHSSPLNQEERERIQDLYAQLSRPTTTSDLTAIQQYNITSSQIFAPFQQIIASSDDYSSKTSLIIIPDGPYNYVPFEALTSNIKDDVIRSFKDLDYLIKHYKISYALSARSFMHLRQEGSHKEQLHFAALGPQTNALLPGAQQEVQLIAELLNNDRFVLEQQREFLYDHQGKFNALHIACHADVDEENHQLNRLRFGDESSDSLHIYNYELSKLNIDARFVLLNACETSIGEEITGEGVYSFTQSLRLAGADAVLSSLWKINDQTSSSLVQHYYEHLQNGASISASLRSAKLDYIERSHPDVSHPYYWSYLVANGNTEYQFVLQNKKRWPILLTISLLFLIVGIVFTRINKVN